MTIKTFNKTVLEHYRREGRHQLQWRKTHDPYAILVSEMMLQQTQVSRVEGYYEKFLKQFPNFQALAKTSTSDVLQRWQGLGYNRRALSLKKTAEIVVYDFAGKLPRDRMLLESLPGIGKGTSGSLMAFAFNKPEIFIETNIRRVFIHFFFPKKNKVTDDELERYIKRAIDRKNPREWYWALMDYGSLMPKRAQRGTQKNANIRSAHYKKQSAFLGSDRELRGKIVRLMLIKKKMSAICLSRTLKTPAVRFNKVAQTLCREGFLIKKGGYFCITT